MAKGKSTKGQTTIYKTVRRKIIITPLTSSSPSYTESMHDKGQIKRGKVLVIGYQYHFLMTLIMYILRLMSGADPGFQVRGADLNKLRRAEGGANIFGVFRV
jgi:hypothetical protein